MAKLFDIIDQPTPQPTPAQLAARHWRDIALAIRGQIKDGVTAIATDCAMLGKRAVLAEMPPELAKEFESLLPVLATLWDAAASIPFPELPDDPPPPPSPPEDDDTLEGGDAPA